MKRYLVLFVFFGSFFLLCSLAGMKNENPQNDIAAQINSSQSDLKNVQADLEKSKAELQAEESKLSDTEHERDDKYNAKAKEHYANCEGKDWEDPACNCSDCKTQKEKLDAWKNDLVARLKESKSKIKELNAKILSLENKRMGLNDKIIALQEQQKLNNAFTVWTNKFQQTVVNAVKDDSMWTKEIIFSCENGGIPDDKYRPKHLDDLHPGDILVVSPKTTFTLEALKDNAIYFADRLYRDLSVTSVNGAEAYHGLVFIGRDASGRALFLENLMGIGSHIIGQTEFYQSYNENNLCVARPQTVVNGKILLTAALEAVNNSNKTRTVLGSDYGVFGKNDMVCTEKAAFVVQFASGLPLVNKQRLIDVTPNDFFDKKRIGKYFVLSPLQQ